MTLLILHEFDVEERIVVERPNRKRASLSARPSEPAIRRYREIRANIEGDAYDGR